MSVFLFLIIGLSIDLGKFKVLYWILFAIHALDRLDIATAEFMEGDEDNRDY